MFYPEILNNFLQFSDSRRPGPPEILVAGHCARLQALPGSPDSPLYIINIIKCCFSSSVHACKEKISFNTNPGPITPDPDYSKFLSVTLFVQLPSKLFTVSIIKRNISYLYSYLYHPLISFSITAKTLILMIPISTGLVQIKLTPNRTSCLHCVENAHYKRSPLQGF